MEAAEDMKLIGQVKNIDEHNVRRNAKNILQHKKSDEGIKLINMLSTHGFVEIRLKRFRDEGIKMNMFLKELEERGRFIFKRKVKIIVNVGKRHFRIKYRHDNSPFR